MRAIEGAVGAMSAYELLALAFVTVIVVAVMVAARAAFTALRARYPRRLNIAGSLLLLHGLVLVLLALAEQCGIASTFVFYAAQDLTNRVIAVVAAASRARDGLPLLERPCGAAAHAAAGVWRHSGLGGVRSGMGDGAHCGRRAAQPRCPRQTSLSMLSPALLPLMASVLAPWSLSRVRHT